jgi:hypothetical protein
MLFLKKCPLCSKRVKKSELIYVKNALEERKVCCLDCSKFFNMLKKRKILEF